MQGTYAENVYITRANIKIYGQTSSPLTYTGNGGIMLNDLYFTDTNLFISTEVTITAGLSAATAGSDDASGTVRVHASGVSLYNLNIANTYGKVSCHLLQ